MKMFMSEVFLVLMKIILNNIKDLYNFEMFNKFEYVVMVIICFFLWKIIEWLWFVNVVIKEMC